MENPLKKKYIMIEYQYRLRTIKEYFGGKQWQKIVN